MKKPLLKPASYKKFIENFQTMLQKKFSAVEEKYYAVVDELEQKLDDIDEEDIPEFTLRNFTFLHQWEAGLISSRAVYDILKDWEPEEVAYLSLIRKLNNYMFAKEKHADLMKGVIALVKEQALPEHVKYVNHLINFFAHAAELDSKQIPISWVTVRAAPTGLDTSCIDMPLNQLIRQLNYGILTSVNQKFYLEDNIICLNERMTKSSVLKSNWIFAPKSYINELKSIYNISEQLDPADDISYIKKLIGEYAK